MIYFSLSSEKMCTRNYCWFMVEEKLFCHRHQSVFSFREGECLASFFLTTRIFLSVFHNWVCFLHFHLQHLHNKLPVFCQQFSWHFEGKKINDRLTNLLIIIYFTVVIGLHAFRFAWNLCCIMFYRFDQTSTQKS